MRKLLAIGLILCLSQSSWAAFSFVISNTGVATGTAVSVSAGTVTAGNLLVIGIVAANATVTIATWKCGSDTVTPSTNSPQTNGNGPTRIFYGYVLSATGGATTCTGTLSTSTNWGLVVQEFSWGGSAGTFDKDSFLTGSGTTASVTSFTPTNASSLVVGYVGDDSGTPTAGAGYTLPTNGTSASSGGWISGMEYNLAQTAATTTPFATTLTDWAEGAMAFVPSGGAAAASVCRPPFCGVLGQ